MLDVIAARTGLTGYLKAVSSEQCLSLMPVWRVLTERWVAGVKSNPIFETEITAFVGMKHFHTRMSEENQINIAVIGELNDEVSNNCYFLSFVIQLSSRYSEEKGSKTWQFLHRPCILLFSLSTVPRII